jgi:hypothetical protein
VRSLEDAITRSAPEASASSTPCLGAVEQQDTTFRHAVQDLDYVKVVDQGAG